VRFEVALGLDGGDPDAEGQGEKAGELGELRARPLASKSG